MARKHRAVHVAKVTNTIKGVTYTSSYLRRPLRQDGKVQQETRGNLSDLPVHVIDLISRSLKGETFVPAADACHSTRSLPQGHVEAVLKMIRKLAPEDRVAAEPSRRRDWVIAMIAERLLVPSSKLADTRHWHDTTLAEEWDVADATADQLDDAMDWLLVRQEAIEQELAKRHRGDGALVLYDVTSSSYEGKTGPLARCGHDRDGKTGCPIRVCGASTAADGRPVVVQVYPGNTGDPTTVPDQVEALTKRCGLSRVVLVGDRGMLPQTPMDVLKEHPGLGWIAALRGGAIRRLLADGHRLRKGLEAVRLAEITSPDFPGERLVACYTPQLAEQRRHRRQEPLAATEAELGTLAASVARPAGLPETAAAIGVRAGQIINPYKRTKDFIRTIRDRHLEWARKEDAIKNEELLAGIEVIRTSEPAARLSAADGVRSYKRLALVEQAFRCLQGIDLWVRPIHHRTADRVRAHIRLCLLAYDVAWHLRRAWEPPPCADEELAVDRQRRDPVAPARASESARPKQTTPMTSGGLPVQSFRTLLAHLGTRCRHTCVVTADPHQTPFRQVTAADALQAEAQRLIAV